MNAAAETFFQFLLCILLFCDFQKYQDMSGNLFEGFKSLDRTSQLNAVGYVDPAKADIRLELPNFIFELTAVVVDVCEK